MKGFMTMQLLVKAKEVSELLQCSRSMAYRVIKNLNDELEKNGFITIKGRVSKSYLCERMGIEDEGSNKR